MIRTFMVTVDISFKSTYRALLYGSINIQYSIAFAAGSLLETNLNLLMMSVTRDNKLFHAEFYLNLGFVELAKFVEPN